MPSTKPRTALSLIEQLALLENPAPVDFDPEALEADGGEAGGDDGSEDGGSGAEEEEEGGGYDGREHYVAVGKSKLKKGHAVLLLDPKYSGARVSRDKLYDEDTDEDEDEEGEGEGEEGDERSNDDGDDGGVGLDSEVDIREGTPDSDEDDEIDSGDALGSEEERFAGYRFRGSLTTATATATATRVKGKGKLDVDMDGESSSGVDSEVGGDRGEGEEDEDGTVDSEDEDDEDSEEEEEGEEDGEEEDESESDDNQAEELARRDQLRKMMAEEQKNVVASITKAAKADADKGAAVRQQQKTFDSFLSIRIKLQKALTSANTLTLTPSSGDLTAPADAWKTAEQSALDLWTTLHDLRAGLSSARTGSATTTKRKLPDFDTEDTEDTSTDTLWAKMRKLDHDATPWREHTLDKWSSKTSTVAPSSSSSAKKLNNTAAAAAAAPRTLSASIREALAADNDRLVARTRAPRSMAPGCEAGEDAEIFDDVDFYQLLLKALVDRRMVDAAAVVVGGAGAGAGAGALRWTTAMREARKRKVVDTKASKGRKLRYQVQEKIQNFMAPEEDGTWHEQQVDELFSSLLGQKVRVDEEDKDEDGLRGDEEMGGLRLFRS